MRKVNEEAKWENGSELLGNDEAEFLLRMIRGYKMRKAGFKIDDLLKTMPKMTRKCYNSIELAYQELLSESYWKIEYEAMKIDNPYICKEAPRGLPNTALKIITLENLVNRVLSLKTFRKEVQSFLEVVHQRELVLKQMQIAVQSIDSEAFFVSKDDVVNQ